MSTNWRRMSVLAALMALVMAFAACGSDSDDDGDESASGADSAATANVPEPRTDPPTEIHVTEPLKNPPTKGKTFFFLQCELPICGKIAASVKEGVAAAGWNYDSLVFKAADPGGGIESAVQRKPDAIGITGIPSAAVKPQLAAAAEAGIPVVTCSPGPEEPSSTTYQMVCSKTTEPDGENMGLWAIKDSGGKAKIVEATISAFPILGTATDGTKKVIDEYCPDCTHDVLDLTVDDLGGGQVGPKLVGYLQSHPDVNYVLFAFSDLSNGVPEALKAAGLGDKVTIFGNQGSEAQMKGIAEGSGEAWHAFPTKYEAWEMVDAALRLVEEGELPADYQEKINSLPSYMVDSPEAAEALAPEYEWAGPEDYQGQFKKLWGVN
jgi:ABC-type sugar transport system substrate-binding protein